MMREPMRESDVRPSIRGSVQALIGNPKNDEAVLSEIYSDAEAKADDALPDLHFTYMMLRNQRWGVRCEGKVSKADLAGKPVIVQKKSGKCSYEIIDRVLWQGRGDAGEWISICSI